MDLSFPFTFESSLADEMAFWPFDGFLLKTVDLDLDLQGQIGLQLGKYLFKTFKLTHLEFCLYT